MSRISLKFQFFFFSKTTIDHLLTPAFVAVLVELPVLTFAIYSDKDDTFTTSKLFFFFFINHGSLIFRLRCTKADFSFLAGKPMILPAEMLVADFLVSSLIKLTFVP